MLLNQISKKKVGYRIGKKVIVQHHNCVINSWVLVKLDI